MEVVGAASAIAGLAVSVFQCAKALRARIRLVASEKAELMAVLVEYEQDIDLLESLYNQHKALLDQHHLDIDLRELAGIMRDLDECLSSTNLDLGKKKLPGFKDLWRAGELREKMVGANTKIGSIRNRWQMRLQVCTLASTSAIYGGQAEMMALLHQMMSMLQQEPVRQRARPLSMHTQVEPAGFSSQTTRVVVDTTTSSIIVSVLSPDASLSHDRIKLRLDEYRTLLASDLDTIELPNDSGKTVICRKEANEMEQFLDQAEALLRDIVRFRDTSAITLLHDLRNLAEVLDHLKLYDECSLTGNCALDLAEALVRRSLEFRTEQAETIALIAGLSVYQPRARVLFIQAVSLCEEVIATNALDTNKMSLLVVLRWASKVLNGDSICIQWLEDAVQIMTDLPLSIVPNELRSVIYYNYGLCLWKLGKYVRAVEVQHNGVHIYRELASVNPVRYTSDLVGALESLALSFYHLGQYDDADAVYKEALEHCRTVPARAAPQCSGQLARILYNYGNTLGALKQVPKALEMEKEALSLYRELAQTETKFTTWCCYACLRYARSCHLLEQHTEAVVAYQESIPLLRARVVLNSDKERYLVVALHNMARSLHALGQDTQADDAATEALQMNQQMVLNGCTNSPDFDSCFVCRRAKAS